MDKHLVMAAQVTRLASATSVEGSPISIAIKDGSVILNDSTTVVARDVEASNGVIHVIDTVIQPPAGGQQAARSGRAD